MGLFRRKKKSGATQQAEASAAARGAGNDPAPKAEAPASVSAPPPQSPAPPTPAPVPTPITPPPIEDEFAALSARAATDPAAGAELWQRVLTLDTWHFIPSVPPGESVESMMAAGKPIGPLVATVEGRSYFMAFTSDARAFECAKANGISPVQGEKGFATLSMAVEGAVTSLCSITDPRIAGIMFNRNAGTQAFFGDFNYLTAMCELHRDRLAIKLFDRFVQAVVDANSDFAWNRLHRRVAMHPEWFHFADASAPTRPLLMNFSGTTTVLLFTDEGRLDKCRALLEQQAPGQGPDLSAHRTGAREIATAIADLAAANAGIVGAGAPVALINMGSSSVRYALEPLTQILAQHPE
jgi:hypothetical protein